jgi:hypothetical protein
MIALLEYDSAARADRLRPAPVSTRHLRHDDRGGNVLAQGGTWQLGIIFTSSANRLALKATYESNPLEVFFLAGGVRTVAMAGMRAAIVVPHVLEDQRHLQIGSNYPRSQPLRR